MNSISVVLIDNHPVTIEGLEHIFARHGDLIVKATGGTARDALVMAEQHRPDLIILDLAIPGNAIAAISEITSKYKNTKIIVFSSAPGIDYAVGALEAGAKGYVSKSCTISEVTAAVRAVVMGDTYVSQNFASGVITALKNASVRKIAMQALKLSTREDQIIHFLLGGKTNKEIASQLGITEKTVKHYMTVLMQKLNARNRVEVVIAAQNLKHGTFDAHSAGAPSLISLN